MALTVADFRIRFPEFADDTTYPDARIQLFLDDATTCVNETCWGNKYEMGVCYLAAHNLWIGSQTSTTGGNASFGGPLQSATTGPKSYTRGSFSFGTEDAQLASTPYGQKYLELRALVRPGCGYRVINDIQTP